MVLSQGVLVITFDAIIILKQPATSGSSLQCCSQTAILARVQITSQHLVAKICWFGILWVLDRHFIIKDTLLGHGKEFQNYPSLCSKGEQLSEKTF